MFAFTPVKFKKIMVAMDDSEDSLRAFNYAVNLAKEHDAEIAIVSILETNRINVYEALTKEYIVKKREELEEHVREYKKAAEDYGARHVDFFVDQGDPGETIVKKILPQYHPDILICGSQAKSRVQKIFLGSQASYMSAKAPCSVVVIRS